MGEVYLATHTTLNRRVAFKVLNPAFTGNREAVDRFMREVRLLAKLAHPNLVTAYTAGSFGDIHYLAMSYVAGETMHSRIQRKGPLGEEEALSVALCVARALHHAWDRHNILHRDVKPSNIMVDDDGEIKLTDLGLSKSLLEEGDSTQSGLLIGTPHYMSPEQAQGHPATDVRTDIYGLGATLYHMLCGAPPFPSDNVREILRGHVKAPPPSIRAHRPEISADTDKLALWMMSKNVANRPADWKMVETELESILQKHFPLHGQQQDRVTTNHEIPAPKEKSFRGIAGLLLLAGLCVGAAMFCMNKNAKPVPATSQPQVSATSTNVANTQNPAKLVFPNFNRLFLPEPLRETMFKLDRRAETLARQNKWGEAAKVYADYRGPLAHETERPRRIAAERIRAMGSSRTNSPHLSPQRQDMR